MVGGGGGTASGIMPTSTAAAQCQRGPPRGDRWHSVDVARRAASRVVYRDSASRHSINCRARRLQRCGDGNSAATVAAIAAWRRSKVGTCGEVRGGAAHEVHEQRGASRPRLRRQTAWRQQLCGDGTVATAVWRRQCGDGSVATAVWRCSEGPKRGDSDVERRAATERFSDGSNPASGDSATSATAAERQRQRGSEWYTLHHVVLHGRDGGVVVSVIVGHRRRGVHGIVVGDAANSRTEW